MREIRFAPSVPGTISLPLSRFPPTGDYIMGYLVTEFLDSLFNHNIPAKIEVVEDIQNLHGMSHFPSIMGLIPNNSFVSSVLPTLGANGFTIDLKSDQKTLTLGEINKSGNMVDLLQTSIQGMSTYIYYNVNVKSSSFTPDDRGQPIDIGYTGPAILDNGVVLSGSTIRQAVGLDPSPGLGLIGLCCMENKIFGFDIDKSCTIHIINFLTRVWYRKNCTRP